MEQSEVSTGPPPCWFGKMVDDLATGISEKAYNNWVITLEDREYIEPGETHFARITLLHPELVGDVIPGDVIEIADGFRLSGRATVIELVDTLYPS